MERPAAAPEPMISEKLKVELPLSLRVTRTRVTAYQGPFAEAPAAEGIEATVLAEEDGAEATDHKVFVRRVSESVPVVFAVTFEPLAKLGVRLTVHCEAGLNACDEEGGVVEAVLGCED